MALDLQKFILRFIEEAREHLGRLGEGLAQLVRKNCDVLASIPIASDVESLNASVAASIALYEVARARD